MTSEVLLQFILFLLAGIIISFLVNKFLLRFSKNLGIRNKNDVFVRWSSASKPSLGGVSLYFVFIAGILIYASVFASKNIFAEIEIIGLVAAGTLAFAIGIMDDAYNTRPLLKLAGQISCGLILVITQNSIDFFHNIWLDGGLTIFWIVALMNSLNMLDNMDGITGTVSLFIIATCTVLVGMIGGENTQFWTLLMIIELGGIIGFMRYNIHPSKLFMGDSGSQFISLFVGFFGIKAIWNLPASHEIPSWLAIFLVMTAFVPTIVDTLSVMINRKRKGGSVMVGGKDHTTHHLVYRGFNDFQVWLIFLGISAFATVLSIGITILFLQGYYLTSIVGVVFFVTVFILLYRNTLKYKDPKTSDASVEEEDLL